MITHERRDDIPTRGTSYSIGDTPSRSGTMPITIPPPTMFGSQACLLAPPSPRRISPMRIGGRRDYSTKASLQFPRAHQFVEQPVDRSAGTALRQPLSTPHNHANPHGLSKTSLESLTDSAHPTGHYGAQPHLRCAKTSTSASSVSSTLSSSAATPNSTYATLTSRDDVRSKRSLPPISTVGLEPLAHNPFADSGGPPNFSSPTYLLGSHTLPPPLHSPFLSASPSGKQHIFRSSGGGSWSCEAEVMAMSLAPGSGTVKTPLRKDDRS